MRNTFYMLRHAESQFTREKTPHQWDLSTKGIEQAYGVAGTGVFDDIDIIVSSLENKALQTAQPIADRVGLELSVNVGLNEQNRKNSGFLEGNLFNETLQCAFNDRDESFRRWETANESLERFKQAIAEIDEMHEGKKILVVSHGTVLSLYFADQLGHLDELYERWKTLENCGWGVVEKGNVVKDIIG